MTVNSWFIQFVQDNINIESTLNSRAKSSRDWLTHEIKHIITTNDEFIALYSSTDFALKMGSYAKKHKFLL